MQLLEVAIGLKAVVASISHYHVAIRGQCQALWAIQWLCRRVDIGQEGTRAVEYLDSAVAPVGHNDVPVGIHSYSRGGIELSIALAVRAKFEEELSISIVHLAGEGARDWGPVLRQRARPWGVGDEAPGRIPSSAA